MTEGMVAITLTTIIALIGACWAVARMMLAQVEKQLALMDAGICNRLEESEKARKASSEQWRALFNELRRQQREIASRIDHLEDRLHQVEHIVSQCHGCPAILSDLPE